MVENDAAGTIRERILEAAAEEFGRAGFSGAKVDAIARRAGVNKAGLYYHLGNKEKLYEAVLLHLFGQVAGALEQAAGEPVRSGTAFAALAVTSIPMARVGVRAAHRLPAPQLRNVFILVMFYVALKMIGVFGWLGLPL